MRGLERKCPGWQAGAGNQAASADINSVSPDRLVQRQTQFLIIAYLVRPELATMIAALALGGGAYHLVDEALLRFIDTDRMQADLKREALDQRELTRLLLPPSSFTTSRNSGDGAVP